MKHNDINYEFWNKGYYAPNVESFIFRFYGHYLKKKKINGLLDFGCGQGAAVNFFNKNKINAYGVDISLTDLNHAKKKYANIKDKFIHTKSLNDLKKKIKKKKFDVIIASQSLYYLSNKDMEELLYFLKKLMNKNGIIFASMISNKSSLFKNSEVFKYGLRKVYSKNKKDFHFMNFTKNVVSLKNRFKDFKEINSGYYSVCFDQKNDINHHYTFIGKK